MIGKTNARIRVLIAGLTSVLLLPVSARAEDGSAHSFSANIAYGSDYIYRGQSQTGNNPAVSGGVDYAYSAGGAVDFYLGTWSSNVSFGGSIETDWYGGIGGSLGETGLGWDAGFLYYQYPGGDAADELDFIEGHIGFSYGFADMPGEPEVGFTVHWSPDWQTSAGDAVYLDGNLGMSLPYGIGLSVHIGNQSVDDNATWGTPDWTEWNVYLSKSIGIFDFSVGYHDTDLSKVECFGGDNICDGRAVVTVSAAF